MRPQRRHFLALAGSLGLTSSRAWSAGRLRAAALFAGRIDDKGFMQSGYDALVRARTELGAQIAFTQDVRPETGLLTAALRRLAQASPDLVIGHGGQNAQAIRAVAAEFPKLRFVVTQGDVVGPNLSSYEVLQEQSAFLAGALAALTTRTGVVGHMSGIRVTPGLKGRAAYAAGVAQIDPKVRLLTNFSGDQDDNALSKRVALAQIAAGADVIFTMLNAGRTGVTEACRQKGVAQIGNVIDWTGVAPDIFIGSAVADSGLALYTAIADLAAGRFKPGIVKPIGLEQPAAIRLALKPSVARDVRARLDGLAAEIVSGRLKVETAYAGAEFPTPPAAA